MGGRVKPGHGDGGDSIQPKTTLTTEPNRTAPSPCPLPLEGGEGEFVDTFPKHGREKPLSPSPTAETCAHASSRRLARMRLMPGFAGADEKLSFSCPIIPLPKRSGISQGKVPVSRSSANCFFEPAKTLRSTGPSMPARRAWLANWRNITMRPRDHDVSPNRLRTQSGCAAKAGAG